MRKSFETLAAFKKRTTLKNLTTSGTLAGIIALLFLFASCANTKVTSSWKASNATPIATGNKILVLGIIQEKDMRLRMQMEGYLVDALKAKGYLAVSAYTLYGPKTFAGKEEPALAQLHNSGIDEVFTISLLDRSKEKDYQPAYGYAPFWGYYSYMYGQAYSPGYISVKTRFFWESNLYDVSTKKLLYSVQSESFNPSSAADMGRAYSKVVVKNMSKEGLVAAK
ncbi:MAG TPA: hypothetical protein VK563_02000 [Puia sp.]|nr:hypothetical protein [Puia sp.]